ncbi:hypothetical protein JAO78_006740 [Alishewanella sp. 16-MA]|uniref:Uncharacterized protein n=1 Tax=Alishewanella maricola TaxID=2795740 RepID=A0ABS8C2H5_9ALTE|nr:hypothetical protein [Alishewanella maricola]MCB5226509.1 hypothetical protein [Alishewanella maricola]
MPLVGVTTAPPLVSELAIGFGVPQAQICVYIAKRPPMQEYAALRNIQPLSLGEITAINQTCGNGWRKVFNVYAKLLFALAPQRFTFQQTAGSWQQFREQYLLQAGSNTALLFSMPQLTPASQRIHIIAGRTHAKTLVSAGLNAQLHWLNSEFAIDQQQRVLVCPYFDYRQLNNEKIQLLSTLISELAHEPS